MNENDRFIPFEQAQPAADHPAMPQTLSMEDVQPNPFDRFDTPTVAPADGPDWSTMMIIARRLESLDANVVAMRQTLCTQAGIICAQAHMLAGTLRLLAERRPPGEVQEALTTQIERVAGTIDPELVPAFRLVVAMVKAGAGLGEPEAAPVFH